MRNHWQLPSLAIMLWSVASVGLSSWLRAAEHALDAGPAARLFEQALALAASGEGERSRQLLGEAVEADPDFALAHWHAGEVLYCNRWQSIEAVSASVSGDSRWQEYPQRRTVAGESLASQIELARWCLEAGMHNEARLHWLKVLALDPDNREALGTLGVRHYRGGLYTPAEIKQFEQREALQQQQTKQYQRQFKRWVRRGQHGSDTLRNESIAHFEAVDDPLAVIALSETLVQVSRSQSTKFRTFNERVGIAIVSALGRIHDHSATLYLLDAAVFAPQAELRRAAATQLRDRDKTSYMPLLMANLAAPVETSYQINRTSLGHVSVVQDYEEEGPLAIRREVVSQDMSSHKMVLRARTARGTAKGTARRVDFTWEYQINPAADYRNAARRVSAALQQVEGINQQRAARNARIVDVLRIVTDEDRGQEPRAWWSAWQQYNELQPYDEKPVYEEYFRSEYRPMTYEFSPVRTRSCFVAGTPVWTQSGPVAIEEIRVNDLVLSQDPTTGRLDYRPVLETTIRPPSDLNQLVLPEERITTTRGHRFWVAGHGWKMAKFLKPQTQLFSTGGLLPLDAVEAVEPAEAYNLVVSDFHTYFVGKSRLLVHDSNCPQPVTNGVPGVPRDRWELAQQLK